VRNGGVQDGLPIEVREEMKKRGVQIWVDKKMFAVVHLCMKYVFGVVTPICGVYSTNDSLHT
jgi:hypothetical protein